VIKHLKPKSEFGRNVLTLMTGTTIAQAIPIAISPILTRIYTPEDFGVFALYISISTIFAVIVTGRYELAIMLPKKNKDAVLLVQLSIMITLFIAITTLIIVIFFNVEITQLLGNPSISIWLYFIPLSICLTGFYQSLHYWNNRKKQYNNLVLSRVSKSAITSGIQVGGGLGSNLYYGLIAGEIIGQGGGAFVLARKAWRENKIFSCKIHLIRAIALLKRYKKILYYGLPMGLLNAISNQLKPLVFSAIFSISIVGWVYMAERMLKAPLSVISGSFNTVFFQNFVNVDNKLQLYVKSYISLLMLSLILLYPVYAHGEFIFEIVFGKDWRKAGELASILYLMVCFSFSSSAISTVFTALERNEVSLIWQVMYFVGLVFLISYFGGGDYLVLMTYLSYWGAGMYFVLFVLGLMCILNFEKDKLGEG